MALIITIGKVYSGYVPTGKFLDLRNHVCVRIAVFVGKHFKALGGQFKPTYLYPVISGLPGYRTLHRESLWLIGV